MHWPGRGREERRWGTDGRGRMDRTDGRGKVSTKSIRPRPSVLSIRPRPSGPVFESKFLRNYYTSAVVFIWLRVQCKIKQKTAVSESKSQNFLRDGGKPPTPRYARG